jgi:hypothetical protein
MKIMFGLLFLAGLISSTAEARRPADEDLNLQDRIERHAPDLIGRHDDHWDSGPQETVWQCTLTDSRGRRWVGQHKNRKSACVVAQRKCIRNTSRKNCVN